MFAVQYAACLDWATAHLSLLRHNNTYLSFADIVLPSFLFASGAALRLTMLRRLAAGRKGAAYRRAVRRDLLLVLLSLLLTWDRWFPRAQEAFTAGGFAQAASEFLTCVFCCLRDVGVSCGWDTSTLVVARVPERRR